MHLLGLGFGVSTMPSPMVTAAGSGSPGLVSTIGKANSSSSTTGEFQFNGSSLSLSFTLRVSIWSHLWAEGVGGWGTGALGPPGKRLDGARGEGINHSLGKRL